MPSFTAFLCLYWNILGPWDMGCRCLRLLLIVLSMACITKFSTLLISRRTSTKIHRNAMECIPQKAQYSREPMGLSSTVHIIGSGLLILSYSVIGLHHHIYNLSSRANFNWPSRVCAVLPGRDARPSSAASLLARAIFHLRSDYSVPLSHHYCRAARLQRRFPPLLRLRG